MTKWEYLYTQLIQRTGKDLDQLGAKGWELVAYDFDSRFAVFKRRSTLVVHQGKSCDCLSAEFVPLDDDENTQIASFEGGCPCGS